MRVTLRLLLCGLCMGAADVVPGVSGGTVAFILGVYEELIAAVRKCQLRFLLPVGLGMGVSILSLARIITAMLGHPIQRAFLYAGFLGLILGSSWFCVRKVRRWDVVHLALLVSGILASAALTSATGWIAPSVGPYSVTLAPEWRPAEGLAIVNYDVSRGALMHLPAEVVAAMVAKGVIDGDTTVYDGDLETGSAREFLGVRSFRSLLDFWMIACGMAAVTAMLLPGVSGSYLLVILGVYPLIISSLADLGHGHLTVHGWLLLANLALGIVLGGLLFSRAIFWLLLKAHSLALALLTGFMLGAIPAVWPFWVYQYRLNPFHLQDGPLLDPIHPVWPAVEQIATSLPIIILSFLLVVACEKLAYGQRTRRALG